MQELILEQSLLVSVGALLFGLLFGLLIGRSSERKKVEGRINEAYQKAQEQAQIEKANLATELHVELDKVRESIIQSAEAYQEAVNSIDSKLSADSNRKDKPAIDVSVRANLEAPTEVVTETVQAQTRESVPASPVSKQSHTADECPSESETIRLKTEGLDTTQKEKSIGDGDTLEPDESDTLERKAIVDSEKSDTEEPDIKKRA